MKKAFAYITVAVLALSSCQTMVKTAQTVDTQSNIRSITVADLKVADQRVTAKIDDVSSDLRRGGEKNVKNAVEQKALTENGGGDILLEPLYVMTKKKGLFGSKITSISVSGRPAWYQNFRTINDSLWNNPDFRQMVPAKRLEPAHRFGPGHANLGNMGAAASKGHAPKQKVPAFRPKGWCGNVDLYLGVDGEYNGHGHPDHDIGLSYMVTANYGYQFGPYFYWGLGTGFGSYDVSSFKDNYKVIPIFTDFRFYMGRKANTLFVDLKMGRGFTVGKWAKHVDETDNAFMGSPSIGYTFGNLDLSAYLMYHENEFEYKLKRTTGGHTYTDYYERDFATLTWGLKLGLRF